MLASDPGRGVDWFGIAIVGLAGLFGYPVHLVIHEAGHLLVALLVGLRVTGVRISLRRQSAVTVRPAGPALAVRMAAFVLGGPLANIAAAALAWQVLRQPLPAPVRMAAALAGAIGLVVAVMNLLPIRLPGSTLDPDGLSLLRWVFRPRRTTAASLADPARLDRIIATTEHPLVLLSAVFRRQAIDSGYTEFAATADRLNAIAHDERTNRRHATIIASALALTFGLGYLHMGVVQGKPIDRDNADELIDAAELGFRLRPKYEPAQFGLAIARLLDGRASEARHLLAGFRARKPETHELATGLFAIAEIYLGHAERADQVIATIGDGDPTMTEILASLRSAPALPALVQAHPADAARI